MSDPGNQIMLFLVLPISIFAALVIEHYVTKAEQRTKEKQ